MAFLQDNIIGPLRTSRSAQILAYGGLALLTVWVLLSRVIGNLPDVMGDELVYATAALRAPMSTAAIPDYLYYWVYSSTGVCGIGFYGCSQVLNTVFSLGAGLLVLIIARRFISSSWAPILIALIFVLGPLRASNSYFMPESMYYFFLALLFWHLTKQGTQRNLGFWIQAGIYLALLSLVKPHALLLIPGIGTYLLFTQWGEAEGRWARLIKEGGSFLVSTVVVKFALGFIFAGSAGLTLFGNSYTGTLNNSLTGAAATTGTATTTAAAATAPAHDLGTSIGFVISQIGIEFLAVVFLGALPLAAAVRYLVRSKRVVEANRPLADFSFLIVNSLAWMVLLIAIFSNMTRMSGEDTANRIMLRYFEFLIPLLLVTLVAAAEKNQTIKSSVRWIYATLGSVLTIVGGVFMNQTNATTGAPRFNLQFVDSPMLKVFAGTSAPDGTGKTIYWMSIVIMVATVIALFIWASNPRWGVVTWVAVVTPVLLILSNSAMISNYAWRSTYTMASDTAGEFVRDSIPAGELPNLVIVAPNNTNKSEQVSKFHLINMPNADAVQTQTVNEGAVYNAPATDTHIKWELALGNVVLGDAGYVVAQAGGVELLRRDLSDVVVFNNPTHTGVLLSSAQGLGAPSAQGQCATLGVVNLMLNKTIQAGDKVTIGVSASGMGGGQSYAFQIGDYSQSYNLPNTQRPVYVQLAPTNAQATNQLNITLPAVQGAGMCLSYLSLDKATN